MELIFWVLQLKMMKLEVVSSGLEKVKVEWAWDLRFCTGIQVNCCEFQVLVDLRVSVTKRL